MITTTVAKIAIVSDITQPSGIHRFGNTAASPAATKPARFPPMRRPAKPIRATVAAPMKQDHT
jgi:hypothetical protein